MSRYMQLRDEVREELRKNREEPERTVKDKIIEMAKELEKIPSIPVHTICSKICKDLPEAKPRNVAKQLDEKYKEMSHIRKDILIARAEGGTQTSDEGDSNHELGMIPPNDEDNNNNTEQETAESRRERIKAQREANSLAYEQSKYKLKGDEGRGKTSSWNNKKTELEDDSDADYYKRENVKLKAIIRQKDALIEELREEIDTLKRR